MIYIKKRAENDLARLIIKLINYKEHPLTNSEAIEYVKDITRECFTLENLSIRTKTSFLTHIKYGKFVHRYDKHHNIQWYIIYDFDEYNNIAIKKIISNNQTKK